MQISSFVLLLLACICGISILWNIFVKALLHYRSVIVEGQIINSQIRYVKMPLYFLSYSYTYNGRNFIRTERVKKATYDICSQGDSVEVRCFPSFAKIARLIV